MMISFLTNLTLFFLVPFSLFAALIDTFYGSIEVEEPVLLELIESTPFQRLKSIHQYGVSYYTTHREEYTRYDHSLGVFAVLRTKNCSIKEQIAGLLHDISHTVFSHVGDWIFDMAHQEKDYQNSIHTSFLEKSGLEKILNKYDYTIDQILPTKESFPALEQNIPNLCADRIDYNIQGAYHRGFITYDEAMEIFEDVQFVDGMWISSDMESLKKIVRFSLFMTQDCWGSPRNHLTSRWLADAILRGIDLGCITFETIHFGTDEEIWNYLQACEDPFIQKKMHMVKHARDYFSLAGPDDADLIIKTRFRGIDPWILKEGQMLRLTSIDPQLFEEYQSVKEKIETGWLIKLF
jgi:uncharacterized protein